MTVPAIKVQGLWKEYVVGHVQTSHTTFYDLLSTALRSPFQTLRGWCAQANDTDKFWALRDVSFEVQSGEVVGVIGRNGAGKSTLLKILSRITAPTKGRIEVHGRLASLLEVGTGFHPELSGRENIFLNGAILGMTRKEVSQRFDEIVAFAEIEKFVDTPVKRYSSGMYVRLAFAVAAHLEPDILVIDEVLSVGDVDFQKRCLGKIKDVAGQGRTVLFVSHNIAAVSRLCSRAIWLNAGIIKLDGSCQPVLEQYENSDSDTLRLVDYEINNPNKVFIINSLRILNIDKTEGDFIYPGDSCIFEIKGKAKDNHRIVTVQIGLYDSDGKRLCLIDSSLNNNKFKISKGDFIIACQIEKIQLVSGRYLLNVAIKEGNTLLDVIERCAVLNVGGANLLAPSMFPEYGPLMLQYEWRIDTAADVKIEVSTLAQPR